MGRGLAIKCKRRSRARSGVGQIRSAKCEVRSGGGPAIMHAGFGVAVMGWSSGPPSRDAARAKGLLPGEPACASSGL